MPDVEDADLLNIVYAWILPLLTKMKEDLIILGMWDSVVAIMCQRWGVAAVAGQRWGVAAVAGGCV